MDARKQLNSAAEPARRRRPRRRQDNGALAAFILHLMQIDNRRNCELAYARTHRRMVAWQLHGNGLREHAGEVNHSHHCYGLQSLRKHHRLSSDDPKTKRAMIKQPIASQFRYGSYHFSASLSKIFNFLSKERRHRRRRRREHQRQRGRLRRQSSAGDVSGRRGRGGQSQLHGWLHELIVNCLIMTLRHEHVIQFNSHKQIKCVRAVISSYFNDFSIYRDIDYSAKPRTKACKEGQWRNVASALIFILSKH